MPHLGVVCHCLQAEPCQTPNAPAGRLRLSFGVPGHMLRALAGATALRRLKIELEEEDERQALEGSLARDALLFQALAALPRLGALQDVELLHFEYGPNRWAEERADCLRAHW